MDAQILADAERLRWLRDGKSINRGYCGRAPFVMLPNKSRLYAIADARGETLNLEVDTDILDNKVAELHAANHLVESGIVGADGPRWPSDEYTNLLEKEAFRLLGWDAEIGRAHV